MLVFELWIGVALLC